MTTETGSAPVPRETLQVEEQLINLSEHLGELLKNTSDLSLRLEPVTMNAHSQPEVAEKDPRTLVPVAERIYRNVSTVDEILDIVSSIMERIEI